MSKELIWPIIQLTGSTLNICGCAAAIAVGAHKQENGTVNPFFFIGMASSGIYALAAVARIAQICRTPTPESIESTVKTFVDREIARRLDTESKTFSTSLSPSAMEEGSSRG